MSLELLNLASKRKLTPEEKVRYAELKRETYVSQMRQAEKHAIQMALIAGGSVIGGIFIPSLVPSSIVALMVLNVIWMRFKILPEAQKKLDFFNLQNTQSLLQKRQRERQYFEQCEAFNKTKSHSEKVFLLLKQKDQELTWQDDTRVEGTRAMLQGKVTTLKEDVVKGLFLGGLTAVTSVMISNQMFSGLVFGFCAISSILAKMDVYYRIQPMYDKWTKRIDEAQKELEKEQFPSQDKEYSLRSSDKKNYIVISHQKKHTFRDNSHTKD